jgi:hypothetical protein
MPSCRAVVHSCGEFFPRTGNRTSHTDTKYSAIMILKPIRHRVISVAIHMEPDIGAHPWQTVTYRILCPFELNRWVPLATPFTHMLLSYTTQLLCRLPLDGQRRHTPYIKTIGPPLRHGRTEKWGK